MPKGLRLDELAERLGARLVGDPGATVFALAPLDSATPGTLSHLSSAAWRSSLVDTAASAVLLTETDLPSCPTNALVCANPYLAYARASAWFDHRPPPQTGVHERASIAANARLGRAVHVAAGAVVGEGAELGDGTIVGPGTVIGDGVRIGAGSELMANVTVADNVVIGARVRVHPGAVIGADGFGFTADENGQWVRIHQLGSVRIGDDADIGACTTIDRGAIGDTLIGAGVKIDNLVQIGHNCEIGDHTLICGCCGIVGSTRIGAHCVLAGGVGVGGDRPIEICSGVMVSGMSHVSRSITEPGVYSSGSVEQPHTRWRRNALRLRELDGLFARVRSLERRLEEAMIGGDSHRSARPQSKRGDGVERSTDEEG